MRSVLVFTVQLLLSVLVLSELVFPTEGRGQALKQEVEKRIKKKELPDPAVQLLTDSNWLPESRNIRFYYETDGDSRSYEAKITFKGKRFSIEFNEEGFLQDIEELVRYSQLPQAAREKIDALLNDEYSRYKIQRVQQQFRPLTSPEELLDSLSSDPIAYATEDIRYELEVDVKEQSQVKSYELLIDSQGQLVQKRLIVRRSLDNFLY